jgi:hypothetical protein
MHWDIVEVKPEADYVLYVRFKDGLSGRVRLDPREFTGVLLPLADIEFSAGSSSMAAPLHGPATSTWLPMRSTCKSLVSRTFASVPPELILVQ